MKYKIIFQYECTSLNEIQINKRLYVGTYT